MVEILAVLAILAGDYIVGASIVEMFRGKKSSSVAMRQQRQLAILAEKKRRAIDRTARDTVTTYKEFADESVVKARREMEEWL